ncbi:hypothetical protein EDB87DRAFT_1675124 [Lactarius vividus]|nr:hypothetical protein EDB87DRAFT_1675124 [Lactarius vividus]
MATLPQPPSFDEHLTSLESLPLFMSSLPEDPTDNVALSALQSLAHDGTPDEIAQNFKEQGNEYFRGKRYREALGFYTQGIDAKPEDGKLREALLLNRAACNLELQNHGSVLRDCAAVISLDPHASKAYYRAGLALLALDRADEALDVCARVGDGAANDAGFKALRERAEKKSAEIRRKADERAERARRASEEKKRMDAAFAASFQARNLIAVPNPDGSANPYAPRFDPEDATGGTLILPVFFLYPEHAMSDVVPDFVEDAEFGTVLATMFPPGAPAPPWDADGRYVRLLKVGRKMTLRDVYRAVGGTGASGTNVEDGLEVKDGCLSFVVVPKGEVEQKWVEEYKSTR